MEPIITVNEYPIGWEWLDNVPLEDFNWLIEIFSTMTDDICTYDFVFYGDSETLPGHQKKICSVDKIPLANFLNEDQYDYFLDRWSGDDEYQYLYDYYENKYPKYNNQLKHYGK